LPCPPFGARTVDSKSQPPNRLRSESFDKDSPIDLPRIHDNCQSDPELALINEVWPELPAPVRAGIVAMVRAATGRGT
jgi:hypothetical protein